MTDPELEALLRRYRPVGPSAALRSRAVGERVAARRTWPWAAAAAVLLSATLGLQFSRAEIHQAVTVDEAHEQEELQMLVQMLGGGDEAVDEARRLLWERQLRDLIEDDHFRRLER